MGIYQTERSRFTPVMKLKKSLLITFSRQDRSQDWRLSTEELSTRSPEGCAGYN